MPSYGIRTSLHIRMSLELIPNQSHSLNQGRRFADQRVLHDPRERRVGKPGIRSHQHDPVRPIRRPRSKLRRLAQQPRGRPSVSLWASAPLSACAPGGRSERGRRHLSQPPLDQLESDDSRPAYGVTRSPACLRLRPRLFSMHDGADGAWSLVGYRGSLPLACDTYSKTIAYSLRS